ncbi:lantibiotic dehydratase [Catellatospora sichuanensis]|uniref:lantibiotic dehydratase n=1 Tax=Catellatospora sichuanensis TaxID=1969805 RepID=UPI00248215AF|nr:lantibiotic dehydratase [Catellatospora sichuanensis]
MAGGPTVGDVVDDPRVRAALTVGNPAVMDALSRSDRLADDSRLARTLQRYLVRMSTRATPYGLFAGIALVAWADTTDVELGTSRPRTRTRPDMEWLLGLVFDVESDPAVRRHLSYVANPEVTERAGRLFAPASTVGGPRHRTRSTVSVRATDPVRAAIALARRPIRHDDLITGLVALARAPIARVEVLVEQLWQQQLLLTDLRPPLTNHDPARYVADKLSGIPQAAEAHRVLGTLLTAMEDFDTCSLTAAEAAYRCLLEMSGCADHAWATAPPQVDMALPLAGSHVHRAVADDAARAAELLLRLAPEHYRGTLTAAYRARFEQRYGLGRAVPLLAVLDPNSGLGSPYAGVDTPAPSGYTVRDQLLVELAGNALCEGRTSIELDESTLERLSTPFPATHAPLSLDVSALLVAESPADVDDGNYHLVIGPGLGAAAAGKMLGRFADLLGEPARTALEEVHTRESELSSEVVFAELAYLPMTAKNANVAIRQHSRHHELVIGVSPGVAPACVIPVGELAVESTGERFRLWWSARGAEVAIVAGHMLDPRTGPDLCCFLADTGTDRRVPFTVFDWGAAAMLPALPRIHVGRIVLCPARYRATPLIRAARAAESVPAFAQAVTEWRTRLRVPRYVNVGSFDYRLLVDLDSTVELDGLRHQLRRHREPNRLIVEEALPSPAHAWLPGPGGRYLSEVVVPLFRTARDDPQADVPARPLPMNSSYRIRPPGSDWLYFKLYCPPAFEDEVIVEAGHEAGRAVGAGLADRWFFVRYADPEPHVRLRLHGRPEDLTSTLFRQLCAWATQLVERGLCSSFTVDTYERELERYHGPEGMAFAEAVFNADSSAVVDVLALRRARRLAIDDVVLAALTCYDLLDTLDEDVHHLAWYSKVIPRRPPPDPARAARVRDVRALITVGPSSYSGGKELSAILADRRAKLAGLSAQLDPASLSDHLHLHHNRLLGNHGSERETLITLGKVLHGLSVAPHRDPRS